MLNAPLIYLLGVFAFLSFCLIIPVNAERKEEMSIPVSVKRKYNFVALGAVRVIYDLDDRKVELWVDRDHCYPLLAESEVLSEKP